jgi:hypothetical protein
MKIVTKKSWSSMVEVEVFVDRQEVLVADNLQILPELLFQNPRFHLNPLTLTRSAVLLASQNIQRMKIPLLPVLDLTSIPDHSEEGSVVLQPAVRRAAEAEADSGFHSLMALSLSYART